MTGDVRAHVLAILHDPVTLPLVEEYFGKQTDGRPRFTGSWFERVEGGGDRPEAMNKMTPGDLLALRMLSVRVPTQAAIWALGDGAGQLRSLLKEIPVDITPRADESAEMLRDDDSALAKLWHALDRLRGIGPAIAGKLCARKRPELAPVYDLHVGAVLGRFNQFWRSIADLFEDTNVIDALAKHQEAVCEAGGRVTLLRTLDIAIWMHQHGYQWVSRELWPARHL